jgi:hypothetical protein
MASKVLGNVCSVLIALAILATGASQADARGKKKAPPVPLNDRGQQLLERYTAMLTELRAEIAEQIPAIDEAKKTAYAKAREAEKAADGKLKEAQKAHGAIKKGHGLVGHAKNKWIAGAKKGIAETKKKLAAAKTDVERAELEKKLAGWEKNLADGEAALKERQAFLDKALADGPRLTRELEAAKKQLAAAKDATLAAVDGLGLKPFLSSNKLDGKLAKFIVLFEGTPRGLAVYAQQSKEHEQTVDQLLVNEDLMLQMVVADGANGGNYGRAMEIYNAIQKASTKAGAGALQRLALATSVEHATPRGQRNAKAKTDAPSHVDPVKRYMHFEKAYLNDELDPGFGGLSAWDYRMVVNGEEPEEILAWGREMLRNYRPDHITMKDYRWRYVAAVRTEIRYGSQDNKHDKAEQQFFQNILMNGGICGRRAFFGRFILRAFGVPTTARPQRGHAALAHWTPDGWVVCLGGGWGIGWTKTRYNRDLDFLANTQARENDEAYMRVKRAQWVGDVVGEKRVFGFLDRNEPGLWYGVSLYEQKAIIKQANAVALAAVGEELGEANESDVKYAINAAKVTEADRKVSVDAKGVITIPAAATSNPTKSTGKIIFMPSVLGGLQMHYSRNGGAQTFTYTFDAPAAGKYSLTARIVTPSWQQHLLLKPNGAADAINIPLPYTVGMWDKTDAVEIELKKGKNVLEFAHRSDGQLKGFTIRDFTLTPVN